MKKTKLWIICEILKYLFYGAVPIGLFIWKCTSVGQVDGGTKFILGLFWLHTFNNSLLYYQKITCKRFCG